ncbi:transcriptional regulator [Paramesorhizobium deserti]|uniref:Transcriptional regulator n=1 Tax=Paramesorhizobium deserti TaxID=1494590 RepID=A0A135HPW1_9HYPH|nr:transcriptional regulator [Paramesorhizobium deserti]
MEVPAVCQACEARHRGVCGALKPEELAYLNRFSSRRTVETGAELAGDSAEITAYCNLLSGVVKLTKTLHDGRQQIVGLQFAPDFVGRPLGSQSTVDAQTATRVSICSFPKSAIDRMIDRSPQLRERLLDQTLKELDEAREWMMTLGRKMADEKVASFLYLIATHFDPEAPGAEDGICFDLPLSRGEIADFLGLTLETVSRQLSKLRKDGVILMEAPRSVTVTDIKQLRCRACI